VLLTCGNEPDSAYRGGSRRPIIEGCRDGPGVRRVGMNPKKRRMPLGWKIFFSVVGVAGLAFVGLVVWYVSIFELTF
jgi:hypothetical protein